METRIEETERTLRHLGQALELATNTQEWDRLSQLTGEYKVAQNQLDTLMAKWEALSLAG